MKKSKRKVLAICGLLIWVTIDTTVLHAGTEAGLSDQQLFENVDLSYEGLGRVNAAVESKDWQTARREWANYLRNRTNVPLFYRPNPKDRGPRKPGVPRVPEGGAIAKADGLVKAIEEGTYKYHFQLRYVTNVQPLIDAYTVNKDSKYAKAAAWLIRDFVTKYPRPVEKWSVTPDKDPKTNEPWLTLNFGLRTGFSWWMSYVTFLQDPAFTDDTLVMMTKSLIQQANFYANLTNRERDTSNWFGAEMYGLMTIGGMFPECPEAVNWRKASINNMYDYIDWRFMPDGIFFEMSYWYTHLGFNGVLEVYERAVEFGCKHEIPADYLDKAVKVYDAALKLCPPDRTGYFFGQGHSGESPIRLCFVNNLMLRALEHYPDREDFRFIASGGQEGVPPEYLSTYLEYGGLCIMRSGWETDANYLGLDAGPAGRISHAHDDAGSVVLWAYGRPLLYDSLHERMNQGGAKFHSTVFIDGKTAPRINDFGVPIDAAWESTEHHDYARSVSWQQEKPWHVRRVVFIKPDIFLVVDNMRAADDKEHIFQTLWNILSGNVHLDKETAIVQSTDQGQANVAIVPLDAGKPVATFLPDPDVSASQKIPAHLIQYQVKGTGEQLQSTLLLPLKPDEDNPIQNVTNDSVGNYTVAFRDNRTLQITVTPGNHSEVYIAEKGGRNRNIIAGNNASKIIPAPVRFSGKGIRVREPAEPDNYHNMRRRINRTN